MGKLRSFKKGFTLVELIIALGVFSAGIMAAFTLALAGLNISKDNYARIQAANLAREGIELVRNQRDSNWLKIDANEDCDEGTDDLEFCDWNENLDYGYYTVDLYEGLLEQDDFNIKNLFNLIEGNIKNKNKLQNIRENMKKNSNKNVYINIEDKIKEFI